ncbi:MAG TPA: hypothetical protein VEK08_10885 [Planctomycetota bacterium]|nr:hypothetical protein [Planctomycetota bacterium]
MGLLQPQQAKTVDPDSAPFIAGRKNKVYHTRQCRYGLNVESPVGFATAYDAELSGRMPCEFCTPQNVPAQPQK